MSASIVSQSFHYSTFLQHFGTFLCLRVSTADCSRIRTFHTRSRRGFLCLFASFLTRDHHVRHPKVVSLTRQATSCLELSEEELVLCIPQSANLCDVEQHVLHPGVRQSTSFMSAGALFNSASLIQGHPTDSHATHHDDAALRLDAKQSPQLGR